mmetsp:Transcript_22168/g.16563  ORF Transcript_22168/g.16563 Transcript_22168/m.16563 type:complete len:120 (+) Transcript_22168:1095-1454(+)
MRENKLVQNPNFQLSQIYWACQDKEFYAEALRILKSKSKFDRTLWSYSILHKDTHTIKEFFGSFQEMKKLVGPDFNCSLLEVNGQDEADDNFNFLDYYPLVNSRAHRIGGMDSKSTSSS